MTFITMMIMTESGVIRLCCYVVSSKSFCYAKHRRRGKCWHEMQQYQKTVLHMKTLHTTETFASSFQFCEKILAAYSFRYGWCQ